MSTRTAILTYQAICILGIIAIWLAWFATQDTVTAITATTGVLILDGTVTYHLTHSGGDSS